MTKRKKRYRVASNHKKRMVTLIQDQKSGVLVAAEDNEMPTPERMLRQGGIVIVDRGITAGGIVTGQGAICVGENIISYLAFNGDFSRDGDLMVKKYGHDITRKFRVAAAAWVEGLYRRAGLVGRITAAYKQRTSVGKHEMTDAENTAAEQLQHLFKRFGHKMANLIISACVFNSIQQTDLPKLIEGLDDLAKWRRMLPQLDKKIRAEKIDSKKPPTP